MLHPNEQNSFFHGKLYCIKYYLGISVPFGFRKIETSTTLSNKIMKGSTISLNYHPCLVKTPSPSVLEINIRLPQNIWTFRFHDEKPFHTVNHNKQFLTEITHYLSAIVWSWSSKGARLSRGSCFGPNTYSCCPFLMVPLYTRANASTWLLGTSFSSCGFIFILLFSFSLSSLLAGSRIRGVPFSEPVLLAIISACFCRACSRRAAISSWVKGLQHQPREK